MVTTETEIKVAKLEGLEGKFIALQGFLKALLIEKEKTAKTKMELVDQHLRFSDTLRENLKEEINNTFIEKEKALDLQAKKYEQRLLDLNHENERILKSQNQSVSMDKFDGFVKEVNKSMDDQKEFKNNLQGRISATSFFVSLAVSLGISILMFILTKLIMK